MSGVENVEDLRAEFAHAGPKSFHGRSFVGADLAGLDLSQCDFTGCDLSRADLSDSRCVNAIFRDATLFETKLDGAELLGADLEKANLEGCSGLRAGFGHARATGASFFHANLSESTFSNATLRDADFRRADLSHVRMREGDLRGADLAGAVMADIVIDECQLAGASFRDADLRGARLRDVRGGDDVDWIGVDIRNVDFYGAALVRRTILDQNYLDEFRNKDRLHRAIHLVWSLTSDCGRSMVRWITFVTVIMVVYGWLYELVAIDYGLHRTPLSPWYFSLVTLTTLGYGDVVPASETAQLLVMSEVLVGYLSLGGLLSIFSNKMARRAD